MQKFTKKQLEVIKKNREETRADMVNDFLSSVPVSEIAKKYNLTRESVYSTLRELPDFKEISLTIKQARKVKKIKDGYRKQLPRIRELRASGLSAVKTSKLLCIPYYAIKELLKGSIYDTSYDFKNTRDEKIRELYKKGKTQQWLAKKYNLSQARVSDILHKYVNELFQRGPRARS